MPSIRSPYIPSLGREGQKELSIRKSSKDVNPRPHLLLHHLSVRLDGRHEQYPWLTTSKQ